MNVELTKEYRFEAAHRLPCVPEGHKCARLHGHSYKVEIEARGPVNPETGWFVDYAVLDEAWAVLHARFDHQNLNDVAGLENSTSENLAIYIWNTLRPRIPQLSAVSVWETADGKCTYRGADHDAAPGGRGARVKPKYLRFMTLNLWGENGPWEARLALVGEKLTSLQPDVVALQEVRDVPGRIINQAEQLGRRRGYQHVFAPSTEWGGGHEGLAILSRFPIGAHEVRALPHTAENEGRIVLSARIDSDLGEIWTHTAHLSYRQHEGREREDQVLAIDEAVTAHKNDNPQVVMGDFNAVPDSDEIRWMCGLTTLGGRRVFYQDSWDVMHAGAPGYTWSRANPYTARMSWLRGDRRLDYIFVTAARRDGRGTVHSSRLLLDEPKVMPDGERLFGSDHFAVVAEIQLAANEDALAPPKHEGS